MDEKVYLFLISQSLEGVMFHNYNIDVFDLLGLDGFKKMHMCQYKDESKSLCDIKHEYIKLYHKMPLVSPANSNFWNASFDEATEETIPQLVKTALEAYYDWESKVLENLLMWRKETKEKTVFQTKIHDVMHEIERLETIMSILEQHEYNYECICEMSNYLKYA